MKNSQLLANRFREVILNGTWIANTNFKDQLDQLDYKIATKKLSSMNTIADLAQHIHYYIQGINEVFKGGSLDIKDKFSFEFTPIQSQKEWNIFLNKFWDDAHIFADFVENMNNEQLNQFFSEEKYGTYQRNIDAMIEHSYYHLGQIVLLKKLQI